MFKFVVMSDLHIVAPGTLSHAIDTTDRLRCAVSHINENHSDAAFCVLAGDLTDNGDAPSYHRMADVLADLSIPAHMTLGNHDSRTVFLKHFGADQACATGYIDRKIDMGDYRVIILDTLQEGQGAGALDDLQLDWLRQQLAGAAGRPVIIVMHHGPAALGVPMDFIRLQHSDAFVDVLKTHSDIRQIISGHVHTSVAGSFCGLPFTTISGNHYNILPKLGGDFSDVPRREGPGQIGLVLATDDTVVVHHETFFDRHAIQPAELHSWQPADDTP
ncbi:metallophosphoesterase [Actibacterium sp. 188UL27-1]|uniref:metallophosphoesterase n=1 Tax=Actibacterium sp. 188UL27-1 TaxID=2786961 RepID=UPI0019580F89|nr:metallophosphoesterase [Actibacterium sp. 188UL27-1]